MVLLTVRSVGRFWDKDLWSYAFAESAETFLEEVQEHEDETSFIINVLPVTDEFYKKWYGRLAGT